MARYIDADALILEISSLSITLGGKELLGEITKNSVIRMVNEQPTADVAPRSEVAREIFEEIHREITEAIKSNVRAIDERQEKHNIYEDDFIHRCYGKIDALRGIDGFITELKEKCAKEDPNADT